MDRAPIAHCLFYSLHPEAQELAGRADDNRNLSASHEDTHPTTWEALKQGAACRAVVSLIRFHHPLTWVYLLIGAAQAVQWGAVG